MGDKIKKVEEILLQKCASKGYLTEDEIIDECIEYDLDVLEIDKICEKILSRQSLIRDVHKEQINGKTSEEIIDKSHIDYNELYQNIKKEYPEFNEMLKVIIKLLPPQGSEWKGLIKKAKQGNRYAYERLIEMYLRTVLKLAYNFSKKNHTVFEDTFQDGVIGMINAIEAYDVTSADNFPAYISLWIIQSMHRNAYIRDTVFRFPVHYMECMFPIINEISDTLLDDDIAKTIEFGEYDSLFSESGVIKEHLCSALEYDGLDEDSDVQFEAKDNIFEEIVFSFLKTDIRNLLCILSDKEKNVIEKRYGLLDGIDRTLEEIGMEFGVTRERVRHIEKKALQKLRLRAKKMKLQEYIKDN
ncbi:sigma-70 family RNA polymerase sigma factor [Butyribacter intestini]|uniref:sigma-70 family RNA polymerase sigma factor n=1 Tax=Butyribacter intestini TaxID=1703332 RepID=UPI0022E2152C|nr:sigma-70 family RNA polymerase sigma factor [Butyribacter intestini]